MKVNQFALLQQQENSDFDPFALNDETYQRPVDSVFQPTLKIPQNINILQVPNVVPPVPSSLPLKRQRQSQARAQANFTRINSRLYVDANFVLNDPQRAVTEIAQLLDVDVPGQAEVRQHFNWSTEKHHKFALAACAYGIRNVTPRQIMQALADVSLQRSNVASHLQKFRLGMVKRYKLDSVGKLQNYHVPEEIQGMAQIRQAWSNPDFQGFSQEEISKMMKQ